MTSNVGIVLGAQTNFSVNLLHETLIENPNVSIILSPISVAIALSMCYIGSRNSTNNEIKTLLGGNSNENQINDYFKNLIKNYSNKSTNYTLEAVNRIYINQNFDTLSTFKEIIKKDYDGQFQTLNFANGEQSAQVNKFYGGNNKF